MNNFNDYTNENNTKQNEKWPYIRHHPYQILVIGGSKSGKTNGFVSLIEEQPVIDKIRLYSEDPYKPKYQFLINKRERTGLKHFDDTNVFIKYSDDMYEI